MAYHRDVGSPENAQLYTELRRIADEQAALRRLSTLVSRGGAADEVFAAVAKETKSLLEFDSATLLRLEPDGTVTVTGSVATIPLLTTVGYRGSPYPGAWSIVSYAPAYRRATTASKGNLARRDTS